MGFLPRGGVGTTKHNCSTRTICEFIILFFCKYNVLLNVMENSYFFILIDFGKLETGSDVCKNNFAKETK